MEITTTPNIEGKKIVNYCRDVRRRGDCTGRE